MSNRKKRKNELDPLSPGPGSPPGGPSSPVFISLPSPAIKPLEGDKDKDKDKDKDDKELEKEIEKELNDAYTEKDVEYLKKLKRKSPLLYRKFIESKSTSLKRSIRIEDIITMDASTEKKATILEKYESLNQMMPYTQDYIDTRNQLRNMYNRFTHKQLVSEDPDVELFKKRAYELITSRDHIKLIEEKIDEYQESERGDEKSKLKRWLGLVTSLPFDKLTISYDDIVHKLEETKQYLDQSLFGMKNVKERLLIFLNKKLRASSGSRGCNLALLGKPGVGKCLHPDTLVRMGDLTLRRAKDVCTGDFLMGDDSTTRLVTSTIKGTDDMYEIFQEYGRTYTVNKRHILTLSRRDTEEIVDVPITSVIGNEHLYTPVSGYYKGSIVATKDAVSYAILYSGQDEITPSHPDHFPLLPPHYLEWTLTTKMIFFKKLTKNETEMRVYIDPIYQINKIVDLLQSAFIRCKCDGQYIVFKPADHNEVFRIMPTGVGQYCGFTITGNRRFLLADWTVTHNTAIAKALSKCLDLPFSQVSFGGVTTPEFLLGHDYTYIGSRPGEITRCLSRMGTKNGIMFFDEFDKASDRKEIMSTLLHITDFSQNNEFRDNYFPEFAQDLSKIWFIYSMNELPKDPAMLDRLEIIKVDGYTFQDKKSIAKNYLFPKYTTELKLYDAFLIEEKALDRLVGMDKSDGVRELERLINLLMEKLYFFLYNNKIHYDYDWFIKMKDLFKDGKVMVDEDLIKIIVSKRENDTFSMLNMYT
jgi:hypothetical protein